MIMSKYIKPEIKFLSLIHESSLMEGSESILDPGDELEEGANENRFFDDDRSPRNKSVWE